MADAVAAERYWAPRLAFLVSEIVEAAENAGAWTWGDNSAEYVTSAICHEAQRRGFIGVAVDPVIKVKGSSDRIATAGSAAHSRLHRIGNLYGWQCYLCGAEIVDTCVPGPLIEQGEDGRLLYVGDVRMLPSIDHVVPRSLNGSSRIANLRLTHRSCNSSKGAM